jgi:hypothetical protein
MVWVQIGERDFDERATAKTGSANRYVPNPNEVRGFGLKPIRIRIRPRLVILKCGKIRLNNDVCNSADAFFKLTPSCICIYIYISEKGSK